MDIDFYEEKKQKQQNVKKIRVSALIFYMTLVTLQRLKILSKEAKHVEKKFFTCLHIMNRLWWMPVLYQNEKDTEITHWNVYFEDSFIKR